MLLRSVQGMAKIAGLVTVLALLVMACGPAAQPTATPTKAVPATTSTTAVLPTSTAVPPTPTKAVAPTATAAAVAMPTLVPATPAPSQTIKRGGVIATAASADYNPVTMDLPTSVSSVGMYIIGPMMNGLLQYDPYNQSQLVGDLAEKYTVNSDGTVITLQLRKDVTWQDGVKFTAADAAWSLDRLLNPPSGYRISDQRDAIRVIDKIETPDEYTLKLTLKYPSASFLPNLGGVRLLMYPKHLGIEGFVKQPVGTGPFKFSDAQPGTSVDLVRNNNYFKKGLPYLDGMRIFIIKDPTASLSAFRTGRLDYMDVASNSLIGRADELQRDMPNIKVDRHIGGTRALLLRNVAPFTDQRVRTAFHLMLNRQQIVALADRGEGTPYAPPSIPQAYGGTWSLPENELKSMPGYREPKGADLVEAKRLLTEAGVDPATFKPSFKYEPFYEPWAVPTVSQFKTLGIEPKVAVTERVALMTDLANGNFELAVTGSAPQVDDPSQDLGVFWLTTSARNYGKFSNPKIDDLYKKQDETLDPALRKQLVLELQRAIINFATVDTLEWGLRPIGFQPWVQNFPHMVQFWSNVYRLEQVWINK